MIFNTIGSNGPLMKSTIIVSVSTGSIVGAYTDAACTTLVKTATERSEGEFWITGLNNGLYYIKATKNTDESIISYTINEFGVYRIRMLYRTIPEFTYTGGTYEAVEDDDTPISDITTYNEPNWKIRFLTSGTLEFSDLKGAKDGIDIFAVGGGGHGGTYGGAGGGYTETLLAQTVVIDTEYQIAVGEGATSAGSSLRGGTSSFGTLLSANGGYCGTEQSLSQAASGGSGGGGGFTSGTGGSGGYDGSGGIGSRGYNGQGQGTTTREFAEDGKTLYAGGGGGAPNGTGGAGGGGAVAKAGTTNTGGGGGSGANGGSGIVIIRNSRSVA